ncbi:MAG: ankyrin repeat domain-containing protein [Leptospiraceae bacterium]|nr:ankyrin repeat domain-containing protein [Leptospiraceae bacterium]
MYKNVLLCLFLLLSVGCASLVDKAGEGDLKSVQRMVGEGANPNETDDCTAPLVYAAEKGHVEVVEYLLAHGADPNVRLPECIRSIPLLGTVRTSGHTALYYVRDPAMVKILMDAGANPALAGATEYKDGSAGADFPLTVAIRSDNLELMELYLKSGATPNYYSESGENFFIWQASLNKKKKPELAAQMIALLRRYGARDLNTSATALKATESGPHLAYRNIYTGQVTTMDSGIAQRLYNYPNSLAPITFDSHQKRYLHMVHFEWVDNGQNLHEWYLQRVLYLKATRKASSSGTP